MPKPEINPALLVDENGDAITPETKTNQPTGDELAEQQFDALNAPISNPKEKPEPEDVPPEEQPPAETPPETNDEEAKVLAYLKAKGIEADNLDVLKGKVHAEPEYQKRYTRLLDFQKKMQAAAEPEEFQQLVAAALTGQKITRSAPAPLADKSAEEIASIEQGLDYFLTPKLQKAIADIEDKIVTRVEAMNAVKDFKKGHPDYLEYAGLMKALAERHQVGAMDEETLELLYDSAKSLKSKALQSTLNESKPGAAKVLRNLGAPPVTKSPSRATAPTKIKIPEGSTPEQVNQIYAKLFDRVSAGEKMEDILE